MTDRRRFFQAKTVQQVPGQKVEVEVELKKGGEAPTCAPTGFFWGARKAMTTYKSGEGGQETIIDEWAPDYVLHINEYGSDLVEQGTAWLRADSYNWYEETDIHTAAMLAIPIGPSCGITWSLSWEGDKPNRHIEFSQDGPVAIIHVRTIEGVDEYNQGTAIITASCAGKTVGALRLVILPDQQPT